MSDTRMRVRTPVAPGHEIEGLVVLHFDDPETGLPVYLVRYARGDEFDYVARQPGQVTVLPPD